MTRLWVFDFDGTLCELGPNPAFVGLHPACRSLLEMLLGHSANRCAILSSRSLAGLAAAVDLPGLYRGGGSGAEWLLPGGEYRLMAGDRADELKLNRGRVMSEVRTWAGIPGVRLEDKWWSVAVHLRDAPPTSRCEAARRVRAWGQTQGLPVFAGPQVFELPLLAGLDKAFGLRALSALTRFDPAAGRVCYAGDDENDGTAVRQALQWGGAGIVVGSRPPDPGAEAVTGPAELARKVRQMLSIGW